MHLDSGFIKVAHDPGDPQLCAHCPFCGSGQITGRSDGGIDCAFCGASFIVRVQPAFPGMPQAPGMGAPTDIGPDMPMGMPGMDPMGALPPGAPGDEEMPPGGGEEEEAAPFGGDEDEEAGGPPDDDEDEEDDEGGSAPPFARKKSSRSLYRTLAGDQLAEPLYIRHLAVLHSGADPAVLAQLRREAQDRHSAAITVTGPPDQLASFAVLCKTIENLCSAGASRTIKYDVDGDGSASLSFDLGPLKGASAAGFDSDPVRVPGLGG